MVKSLRNVPFIFILYATGGFSRVLQYGSQCSNFLLFFHAVLGTEVKLVRYFIPGAVYSKTKSPLRDYVIFAL